jgi:secreted trypsin-like serine protease
LKLPGGVCFGDSGGPRFLGTSTTIVAVTSGGDMTCSGMNWSTRLDTPGSRSFLRAFVTLP